MAVTPPSKGPQKLPSSPALQAVKPIPKKASEPSLVVQEAAMIASSFAQEFEKLMREYQIQEYKISVRGPVFQLTFEKKPGGNE